MPRHAREAVTEQCPRAQGAQLHDGKEVAQKQLHWTGAGGGSQQGWGYKAGEPGPGSGSSAEHVLMHLFFFFLLCKAGGCHRRSAGPWQAVKACILCSGSQSLGLLWVLAGNGDAGRRVAMVTLLLSRLQICHGTVQQPHLPCPQLVRPGGKPGLFGTSWLD